MELTHRYGGYKLADGDGIGVNHCALHGACLTVSRHDGYNSPV
eukprot:COSAG02_NODE_3775_length_6252_cov_3.764505_4_plen_43_part_00